MYHFHATIHARPPDAAAGSAIELGGRQFMTLSLAPEVLGRATLECSFEEAALRLANLPRMYCEPDGSFVWTSPASQTAWQVDGNLYDRNGRLLFVDIKGSCPPEDFDRLLSALGWPRSELMFQLVRQAVLLDEQEFRRWAAG